MSQANVDKTIGFITATTGSIGRSMTSPVRSAVVAPHDIAAVAEDVRPPALHRLYRATATETSVLGPAVRGVDRRTSVAL